MKTSNTPTLSITTAEYADPTEELEALQAALETPGLPEWFVDVVRHRIEWLKMARPAQLPPEGEWDLFLALAGRGFGKTRLSAEDNVWFASCNPGVRIGIVAPTLNDLRKICFEGESGLVGVLPQSVKDHKGYKYNRALFELTLPNSSKFEGFASEAYERLRGPQFHRMWFEELAAWSNIQETYDQAMFTLRLNKDANGKIVQTRAIASTTPKPLKLIKELVKDPGTVITKGSTYENAENLAPAMLRKLKKMEGTDLGKQEIHAEILDFSNSVAVPRKNWKLWPVGKKIPLPELIVPALDSGYKDGKDNDSSACVVWAVCRIRVIEKVKHPYLNTVIERPTNRWAIILVDSWKDKLLYPDLKSKFKDTIRVWEQKYIDKAEYDDDHIPVDPVIEDKASGTALLAEYQRAGIRAIPFDTRNKSKKARVDMISEAFRDGKVYAPGTIDVDGEIRFKDYAEQVIKQFEDFTGIDNGENDVDDLVDAASAGLHYIRDMGYMDMDSDTDYFLKTSQEEMEEEANQEFEQLNSLYG